MVLSSFFLLPASAMDEEEIVFSSPNLSPQLKETSALLLIQEEGNSSSASKELRVIKTNWTSKIKELNNRIVLLRLPHEGIPVQTALVKYTEAQLEYDYEEHESRTSETSRPYLVLKSLEAPVFDEEVEPRRISHCCSPSVRTVFKWLGAAGGAFLIGTVNAGLKNGAGRFFNYEEGGAISYTVVGVAFLLDGLIGGKIGYNFVEFILEKPRTILLRMEESEVGKTLTQARLFPKSNGQRFWEVALVPAAGMFALIPISAYLNYEASHLVPAICFSVAGLVYFGKPYYEKGLRVLKKIYANNFSTEDHRTREIRRALDASLADLEELLRKDKNTKTNRNKLLKSIWSILDDRTRHFGKDGRIEELEETEIVSALSVLFTNVLATNEEPETEYEANWNNMLAQRSIKEKSFKEKVISESATGLTWLNLYPGIVMESYAISNPLQAAGVPSEYAVPIGYAVAGLLSTRLFLEREFHHDTLHRLAYPLTSTPDDTVGIRRATRIFHSAPYAAFNALVFYVLYSLSSASMSGPLFYIMMPFVLLRYLSLFYSISAEESDDAITRVQIRSKESRSLNQKSAQVNNFIARARMLVRSGLSNESILELSKVIFRGN